MPALPLPLRLFLLASFMVQTLLAQSDVAFSPEVYARRRARLAAEVGDGLLILPAGDRIGRGANRPDPNFWYLTGVESPYALLVMQVTSGKSRETLFLPDRFQFAGAQFPTDDPRFREASWNLPIRRLFPGPDAARATGIARVLPLSELVSSLRQWLFPQSPVFFLGESVRRYAPPGLAPPLNERQQLEKQLQEVLGRRRFENLSPRVERMRLIKDSAEIAALRKAAEISSAGLLAALKAIRPGVNDLEIAGVMELEWKRQGSPRTAFGSIVSSGAAAISLFTLQSENYNPTDHVASDGELIFIDYGAAEWMTYASDICRTYPVSGQFTPEQRKYYEIVLEAQEAALARIRPGIMMLDVIRAAAEVYRRHQLEPYEDIDVMGPERVWGIMPSPTYYLARNGQLTDYSGVRGTGVRDLGHHVGLEATDSRDYSIPLAPGMVFTIEPKLYIPEKQIAIMIEDVVLVTEAGYDNLSLSAPKSVAEIERIMGSLRR